MRISTIKISFLLLVFLFLYMPPIFPRFSVAIWAMIFLLFCMIKRVKIKNDFLGAWVAGLIIVLWSLMVDVYNNGFTVDIVKVHMSELLMLFYVPFGIWLIINVIDQQDYSKREVYETIIQAGIIQSFFAILAYVINPIQSFFCMFLQNVLGTENVAYWRAFRLYGLSAGMSYAMPILQGLIGGLCLLYATKYNSKYYIAVPLIWLSGIINARVCLVVVAVEMIIWIFRYGIKSLRRVKLSLFVVGVVFFIAIAALIIALITGLIDLPRITDPIKELVSIIQGDFDWETEGYFSYFIMNENALNIPNGSSLFFGSGLSLARSDVGYIRNIWAGGLIFSICLYIYYIGVVKKWRKMSDNRESGLWITTMAAVLFTVNIKGDSFLSVSEFLNLFFLGIAVTHYFFREKISVTDE